MPRFVEINSSVLIRLKLLSKELFVEKLNKAVRTAQSDLDDNR